MADQTHDYETHDYDVIIIGAGGSGLRAAIEAKERGLRVALVCKSLLGKAHTVMAEGGMAAAMGHVWPEDNWQVHFRDTMRGGKMLNNWRMAQIHALEGLAVDDDAVAGVVATLVAHDHVHLAGEEIGELALPLVAPLSSDHDGRRHVSPSAGAASIESVPGHSPPPARGRLS